MSRRATEMHPHPFAKMIHDAWKASELPLEDVVFKYKTEASSRGYTKENGMLMGSAAVKRWCYGWSIPQLHQYDILATIFDHLPAVSLRPVLDKVEGRKPRRRSVASSNTAMGYIRLRHPEQAQRLRAS